MPHVAGGIPEIPGILANRSPQVTQEKKVENRVKVGAGIQSHTGAGVFKQTANFCGRVLRATAGEFSLGKKFFAERGGRVLRVTAGGF